MLVWRGNSALDGSPIMLILAESKSSNAKTGDMAQTYILRDTPDVKPSEHVKAGNDASICGTCPFRAGKGCYVDVAKSVNSTFRANVKRTIASDDEVRNAIRNRPLRIGAYGDPAAVPYEVWERLVSMTSSGHTGYTHQWRTCDNRFARLCMASVEDSAGMKEAHVKGYRTFRVASAAEPGTKREIMCLNTSRGINCADCGLCNGAPKGNGVKSIVIAAHGVKVKAALASVGQ